MVVLIDFNSKDVIFGMLYISRMGFDDDFFRGYCWPSVGKIVFEEKCKVDGQTSVNAI